MNPYVIFLNEPKLSEHEVDADFNERRKDLTLKLEDFIINHPLFLDEKVEVTFLHTGVSSLVCILDTSKEKYVLKIPLSKLTSGLESTFLKAWEQVGVKIPHIFDEGKIGEHFYVLMEYIETELLAQKYNSEELIKNKMYKDLGTLLRKMHQVKSEGYSNVVNDKLKPQYSSIEEWLTNDIKTNEQFRYVKEHKLLNSIDHGSIEEACNTIISHIGSSKETVYCHNDFHNGNIFATEPFTVFDPWPCFHHPYMDVGRTIYFTSKAGSDAITQFIEGYFGDEKYNNQLLQAFITLNIWAKLPYIHKRNQMEKIKDLQEYLSQTKNSSC